MTRLQKLTMNVRDLGKLIVAKGFKNCPKSNKLPNLVTLEGLNLTTIVSTTERENNKENILSFYTLWNDVAKV